MLTIWGRANSSNVQKVLWCCDELGVQYQRIDAGRSFGRTDAPEYRAMNPNGLVPTVQDGDAILWESNTILRYLATTRGGARLYPTEPYARSLVERWMDWQIAHLAPPMTTLIFALYRTPPEQQDRTVIEAARLRAEELFTMLDGVLGHHEHVAGPAFSLADIALGIFGYRWLNIPVLRQPMPHLEAWYERLKPRAGFAAHVMQPIS